MEYWLFQVVSITRIFRYRASFLLNTPYFTDTMYEYLGVSYEIHKKSEYLHKQRKLACHFDGEEVRFFLLVACMTYISNLKMVAVTSSETSATLHIITSQEIINSRRSVSNWIFVYYLEEFRTPNVWKCWIVSRISVCACAAYSGSAGGGATWGGETKLLSVLVQSHVPQGPLCIRRVFLGWCALADFWSFCGPQLQVNSSFVLLAPQVSFCYRRESVTGPFHAASCGYPVTFPPRVFCRHPLL
jgi:hypothetical protein